MHRGTDARADHAVPHNENPIKCRDFGQVAAGIRFSTTLLLQRRGGWSLAACQGLRMNLLRRFPKSDRLLVAWQGSANPRGRIDQAVGNRRPPES